MPEMEPSVATDSALARIIEEYRQAWETRDPVLAAGLFSEDATYQENLFNAPFMDRAAIARYRQEATASHRHVRFQWPLVCRSGRLHVVEWAVEFTRTDSGKRHHLRGVMLMELRDARILRFHEYWLRRENR